MTSHPTPHAYLCAVPTCPQYVGVRLSPQEKLDAHDGLVAALRALVDWAEGEGPEGEGEGCRWCLFSTNHEDGCPVGDARALLARLSPKEEGLLPCGVCTDLRYPHAECPEHGA